MLFAIWRDAIVLVIVHHSKFCFNPIYVGIVTFSTCSKNLHSTIFQISLIIKLKALCKHNETLSSLQLSLNFNFIQFGKLYFKFMKVWLFVCWCVAIQGHSKSTVKSTCNDILTPIYYSVLKLYFFRQFLISFDFFLMIYYFLFDSFYCSVKGCTPKDNLGSLKEII